MRTGGLGRQAGLAGAAVGLALLAVVSTAGAQDGEVTFERSPASGPPGTVISVSGTGCLLDGEAADFALVDVTNRLGSPNPAFGFFMRFPVEPDGSWAGEIIVPPDALPEGYVIGGLCALQDQAFGSFESTFTVTGPSPPPSSTSTTSTTRPPGIVAPPVAPPADPVSGTPRYTG